MSAINNSTESMSVSVSVESTITATEDQTMSVNNSSMPVEFDALCVEMIEDSLLRSAKKGASFSSGSAYAVRAAEGILAGKDCVIVPAMWGVKPGQSIGLVRFPLGFEGRSGFQFKVQSVHQSNTVIIDGGVLKDDMDGDEDGDRLVADLKNFLGLPQYTERSERLVTAKKLKKELHSTAVESKVDLEIIDMLGGFSEATGIIHDRASAVMYDIEAARTTPQFTETATALANLTVYAQKHDGMFNGKKISTGELNAEYATQCLTDAAKNLFNWEETSEGFKALKGFQKAQTLSEAFSALGENSHMATALRSAYNQLIDVTFDINPELSITSMAVENLTAKTIEYYAANGKEFDGKTGCHREMMAASNFSGPSSYKVKLAANAAKITEYTKGYASLTLKAGLALATIAKTRNNWRAAARILDLVEGLGNLI